MALIKIDNVKIAGLSACVPSTIEENCDYPYFEENELERILPSIGVERRRVAKPGQTCGDFAYKAAEKLLGDLGWDKSSIGLLVYVSAARDYILPDTACVIHGKLGLSETALAFDMTLGCTGWTYGLTTVASIMQNGGIKRALLLNGNMGSAECAFTDKTAYPLFSDTGTATALEFDRGAHPIWCELGTDGKNYDCIIIPDGGRRNQVTKESLVLQEYGNNIRRNRLHIEMKGMEVFSFALKTAPMSFNAVLEFANKSKDDVDLYVFHQANYYMVKKIIKKLKLDPQKTPFSMINYGNTGASSIPFTLITEKATFLKNNHASIVGCSFGVGLSWASLYFETDSLVIPDLIIYD